MTSTSAESMLSIAVFPDQVDHYCPSHSKYSSCPFTLSCSPLFSCSLHDTHTHAHMHTCTRTHGLLSSELGEDLGRMKWPATVANRSDQYHVRRPILLHFLIMRQSIALPACKPFPEAPHFSFLLIIFGAEPLLSKMLRTRKEDLILNSPSSRGSCSLPCCPRGTWVFTRVCKWVHAPWAPMSIYFLNVRRSIALLSCTLGEWNLQRRKKVQKDLFAPII